MRTGTTVVLLALYIAATTAQCDFEPEVIELAKDTMDVTQTESTRCLIGPEGENCIGGYGKRSLLRFTTLIHNVGQDDCIVGSTPFCPAPGIVPPDQGPWHFASCHQHWHLQGYADYYVTYPNPAFATGDAASPCDNLPPCPRGNACRIHEGHKTGFCLMDSYCGDNPEDPLKLKYICRFQGITATCMDAYVADLPCQWVDFTDVVPSRGNEELCLCVTVNSDQNVDTKAPNIATESNKQNNRHCVPFKYNSLPKFEPRNSTFTRDILYLESKNKCLGWSNASWLDQSQMGRREAAVVQHSPLQRQQEGRKRLTKLDIQRIKKGRAQQKQQMQEYAQQAKANKKAYRQKMGKSN